MDKTAEKACRSSSSDVKSETLRDLSKGSERVSAGTRESQLDYSTSSTYNIYHQKDSKKHFIITPLVSEYQESIPPRRKLKDKDIFSSSYAIPAAAAANTFFVHKPYLSFHHPPRTLRRGPEKNSPVVCLINNSWFWRKWKLQFGSQLQHTIDPRGVMPEDASFDSSAEGGTFRVKGYKVRSWRLWGESGKKYHREVNQEREARKHDPSPFSGTEKLNEKPPRVPVIEEELQFFWHSPFTHKTRFYRFDYAGLEFYWKGTGTVNESRTCGWWLRFNHLKLCVRLPIEIDKTAREHDPIKRTTTYGSILQRFGSKTYGSHEICLAKFTSSMAPKKAGVLQIYDDVLHRVMMEYNMVIGNLSRDGFEPQGGVVGVKATRLYEIIIATAMCMIIAEWQKRETVKAIIVAAMEGAGK